MRVFERQNDCIITFHLHKSLILGRPDPLLFMREGVATPDYLPWEWSGQKDKANSVNKVAIRARALEWAKAALGT